MNTTVNKSNGNVSNTTPKTASNVPVYTYEIVNTYKHDSDAFTQGLVFQNGFMYESTGQRGKSTLRKVELESGKVLRQTNCPEHKIIIISYHFQIFMTPNKFAFF
jgi:glutamine cyclotransferase